MTTRFVRHALAKGNAEQTPMGSRFDSPLHEVGGIQAAEFTTRVRNDIDAIFSSPLLRALETAEPTSKKLGIPVRQRAALRERDHGSIDGKKWDEIARLTEGRMSLDVLHSSLEHDFSPYGGESIEVTRARVREFVLEIITEWKGKNIMVFTHAGIIKVVYALAGNSKPPKIENVSIHEFSWETLSQIVNC